MVACLRHRPKPPITAQEAAATREIATMIRTEIDLNFTIAPYCLLQHRRHDNGGDSITNYRSHPSTNSIREPIPLFRILTACNASRKYVATRIIPRLPTDSCLPHNPLTPNGQACGSLWRSHDNHCRCARPPRHQCRGRGSLSPMV